MTPLVGQHRVEETLVAHFDRRGDRDAFAVVAADMGGVVDEVKVHDAVGCDFVLTGVLAPHLRSGRRTSAPMAHWVAQAAAGYGALQVERQVDGLVADRLV